MAGVESLPPDLSPERLIQILHTYSLPPILVYGDRTLPLLASLKDTVSDPPRRGVRWLVVDGMSTSLLLSIPV